MLILALAVWQNLVGSADDVILWDDGSDILWDDGSQILCDS